jgi:hypothetical protein
VQIVETSGVAHPAPATEVARFVRGAFGLRFEMRFRWETKWWPIDAQQVGETLAGYYRSTQSCLEQMREGGELPSGLAYFRMRR